MRIRVLIGTMLAAVVTAVGGACVVCDDTLRRREAGLLRHDSGCPRRCR
jgi:hypothetical protein